MADKLADGLADDAGGLYGNYHPAGWVNNPQHGADFNSNPQNCKACHGDDLNGGESGVSCLTCHHGVGGPYPGHTGRVPHNSPGDCDGCHGRDFNGATFDGLAVPSCFECHADRVSMKAGVPDNGACAKSGCHPALQSHPAHTGGNNRGPSPLDCEECHTQNSFIYEVYADDNDLIRTGVCDQCHSPDGAFDGVNDAVIGAKANWADGVYEADGKTLKAGKEQWCAGCHDNGTAFSRPIVVADVIVDNLNATYTPSESAWPHSTGNPGPGSFWGTDVQSHAAGGDGSATCTWTPNISVAGAYKVYARWTSYSNRATNTPYTINYDGGSQTVSVDQTTNGGVWYQLGTFDFAAGTSGSVVLDDSATGGAYIIADAVRFENIGYAGAYAPNVTGDNSTYGYYVNGHKLTCTVCHDASSMHIDHNPRTYEVDESTLMVVNPYEVGYRLRELAGQRPMIIPKYSTALDPSEFALCFVCHDSDPILQLSTAGTNFWSNDATPINSHWYHLLMTGPFVDSDGDAVISGTNAASNDSAASCTTCHNVHGSDSATMTRHGELISTYGTTNKVPAVDFCYLDGVASRNCAIKKPKGDSVGDSVGGSMRFPGAGHPEGGNAVCSVCHNGITYYYRTPIDIPTPTDPKVSNPLAKPVSVANDGASPVLFKAFVVDPDENLSSVEIDLSALSGSATQTMYDDGTNGDETAGDDIYSYLFSGTTASVGNYTPTITATDGDSNIGTGQVVVIVHNEAGTIIVDNLEATFVCTWNVGTGFPSQIWGPNVRGRAANGSGACTATWVPDIPAAGNYQVYARWSSDTNRATSVPYTINYDGGSDTVYVNQQANGGAWNLLGSYPFAAGTSGAVVLDNSATGPVNAVIISDAIKLEPVP